MKTFTDDKPLLRYALLGFGVVVCSFLGTISAILLIGVLFK